MNLALTFTPVFDWRGTGTISGTVRAKTGPTSYTTVPNAEVWLIEQVGVIRSRAYSAADGTFAFAGIDLSRKWMVLAIHPTGAYSAVATDRVTA